jgi:hypothetical protein
MKLKYKKTKAQNWKIWNHQEQYIFLSYHERQKKIVKSSKNLQPKKFKPSKDIEHEGNREDGRYFEIDGGWI